MDKIIVILNLINDMNGSNNTLIYLLVGTLCSTCLFSFLLYKNIKALGDRKREVEIAQDCISKRELKEMNDALSKSNILLSAILESSPEIVVFALDIKYRYISFNNRHKETIQKIWGKNITIGKSILEIINREDDSAKAKENFDRALRGESFMLIEEYGDERLSRLIWQNYYAPIYSGDKEIVGLTCFVIDVTDRKKAEDEIIYLSYHDELTGLYNRRFFEEEVRRLDTQRNLPVSIIVGDINGLKLTNDIFGHCAGDLLIQKTAQILKKVCRADDIIARVGGDEFSILLPKTELREAEDIITRVKNKFAKENVKGIRGSIAMGCHTKVCKSQDIFQVLKDAGNKMYSEKTLNQHHTRGITIETVVKTLHETSPREREHSKAVSNLCEKVGRTMNLSEIEIRRLKEAGLLHDIGKVVLDENLLNKGSVLTDEELRQIKRHPVVGYRILNLFDDTLDLAEAILSHHERWDGEGYPKGLKGEEIPKLARVIAVAGHYDAMLSMYGATREEAIEDIREQSGAIFDPNIVNIFTEMVLNNE